MSRVAQMTHPVSVGHPLNARPLQTLHLMSQAAAIDTVVRISDDLPTSVRGAPAELRRIIRKRQNSESAKRCRQRKKIENARTAGEIMTQAAKVQHLEAVVQHLAKRLEETQALIASYSSAQSSVVFSSATSGCRNGHPKCRGSECSLCVRDIQASSARVPMSAISSPLVHGATGSSQMENIPMNSSTTNDIPMLPSQIDHLSMGSTTMERIPQDVEKHTHELAMALGERHSEDAAALANKIDEIETSGWQ